MNGNEPDRQMNVLPRALPSLPLVSFEEYMLVDDCPAYPMNFFARLKFSGRFDREKLNEALGVAVSRHPLLHRRVEEDKRGRLQWVAAEEDMPAVEWIDVNEADAYPRCRGLDLSRRTGLHVRGLAGEESEDLLLQFHHSCCDGMGAFQFIEDLLVLYAMACGNAPEEVSPRPLDEWLLRGRGRFHLSPLKFLRMLPDQAVGLLGARQFLMRRPIPVVPHEPPERDETPGEAYPSTCTSCLTEDETAKLRAAAKRLGKTVNDLLLGDLFLAMNDWRKPEGFSDEDGWLRLSVPMNLRAEADRHMPAANVVSMVFLDRKGEDFADAGRLLDGISEEMQLIKRRRLGFTFVLSLAASRFLPGGLRRQVKTDRCTATAVITNLGSPAEHMPLTDDRGRIIVGDMVLESMELLAPLRPYTIAAFAAFTYAGKLCVTLHHDARYMDKSQATGLLDTYMQFLRASSA